MNPLQRRIERAEEALQLAAEPAVQEIVMFGGGPLPPEQRRGNVIIRHILYAKEQRPCGISPND